MDGVMVQELQQRLGLLLAAPALLAWVLQASVQRCAFCLALFSGPENDALHLRWYLCFVFAFSFLLILIITPLLRTIEGFYLSSLGSALLFEGGLASLPQLRKRFGTVIITDILPGKSRCGIEIFFPACPE